MNHWPFYLWTRIINFPITVLKKLLKLNFFLSSSRVTTKLYFLSRPGCLNR
eukprot:UN07388